MAQSIPLTMDPDPTSDQPPTKLTWEEAVDQIGNAEVGKVWQDNLQTTKRTLSIVCYGRAGSGKSSLLKGFLGQNFFKEDDSLSSQFKPIYECTCEKDGYSVTVWDCSGLQDGTHDERMYFEELAKKTNKADGIDLLLYCISMKDVRSASMQTHFSSIRSLTASLSPDIWKNSLVVLTFANMYVVQLQTMHPNISNGELLMQFDERIQEWRSRFIEELVGVRVPQEIASKISIHPAGYHTQPHLPGCHFWASILWAHAFFAVKSASKPIMLIIKGLDRKGFKTADAITDDTFRMKAEDQPIIVTPELEEILAKAKEEERQRSVMQRRNTIVLCLIPAGIILTLILVKTTCSELYGCGAVVGTGLFLVAFAFYQLYREKRSKKRQ